MKKPKSKAAVIERLHTERRRLEANRARYNPHHIREAEVEINHVRKDTG
jgi:hypothetical protein